MRAIAGTHTVLLAMDLRDPTGCLGFAIKRTEILPQGQGESVWLKGMKTFSSVENTPPPGSQWPTNAHPIQGFQWGDYGAVPGRTYVYAVSPVTGTPAAPTLATTVEVKVTTEVEDDGVHGVWFNRGVAGSQAFARRFAGSARGVLRVHLEHRAARTENRRGSRCRCALGDPRPRLRRRGQGQ